MLFFKIYDITKMIIKCIFFSILFFYIHIFFIFFISTYLFLIETKYIKNINLSYEIINKYKSNFNIKEKIIFKNFNIKEITLNNEYPSLKINNIIYFQGNKEYIGLIEDYYINNNDTPEIKSNIPIYDINEFLIKQINKQYKLYYLLFNEKPFITILNKKSLLIKNNNNINLIIFPWQIINKFQYKEIIEKKIFDLRIYSKNKE